MKTSAAYFGHKFDQERDEIVYLCLERYIRIDSKRDLLLSSDLRTEDEIDDAILTLRRQLETAGKAAKADLRKRQGRRKRKGD